MGLRLGRQLARGLALLVAAGCAWAASAPTATAEEDGLAEETAARYVIGADGRPISATVTVKLINTQPDRRSGNRIYYTYFDSYAFPVPGGVTAVKAVSGGRELKVSLAPAEDGYQNASVGFSPLRHGSPRTITFSYELPGSAIRSEEPTRVGKGFAAFSAFSWGDAGANVLEIVAPAGYEFNSTPDIFEETIDGDLSTWRAAEPTGENGTWAFVTLRDPEQAASRSVTVGGDDVAILSFPGDDEWGAFVEQNVTAGLPELEALTGTPWPGGLETIREDVSPTVTGYAWFDVFEREIRLGEELDPQLLLHETSHAWFNSSTLGQRWLIEGLAEVVSTRAAVAIDAELPPPEKVDPASAEAFPLDGWVSPEQLVLEDADLFGYPAAQATVEELIGDLDDEAFVEVVAAALAGESAYELPGAKVARQATNGRRFLDLVETRGGNTEAAATYRTWVLAEKDHALLEERAEARELYAAFDERDGAWQPPQGLRWSMSDWRFGPAEELMDRLDAAAAEAGDLQDAAGAARLDLPDRIQAGYEEADTRSGYEALPALLAEASSAVSEVTEAELALQERGDPFSEAGEAMLGLPERVAAARDAFTADDLDAAVGHSAEIRRLAGYTPWLGAALVPLALIPLGWLLAGGLAVRGAGRRRRARRLSATPATPAEASPASRQPTPEPTPEPTSEPAPQPPAVPPQAGGA